MAKPLETTLPENVIEELVSFAESINASRFQLCLRNLLLDYLLKYRDHRLDFDDLLVDLERLFVLLDRLADEKITYGGK